MNWLLRGIPAKRVFEAATIDNARFFRIDDYGTVETGKQASLLLLRANPLDGPAAFDTIETVIRRGARGATRRARRRPRQRAASRRARSIEVTSFGRIRPDGHTTTVTFRAGARCDHGRRFADAGDADAFLDNDDPPSKSSDPAPSCFGPAGRASTTCAGARETPRPSRGCRTPRHCRTGGDAPWCDRGTTAYTACRRSA
jgi:hypothetical protein